MEELSKLDGSSLDHGGVFMNKTIDSLDVIVLTKNSEKHLRECLESIYTAIPVHHLIIVDAFSTDKTIEIVENFRRKYGNVIMIQDKALRGKAREIGIRHVDTEWFSFVDSDIVLISKWFNEVRKHMGPKIGAIQTANIKTLYPSKEFSEYDNATKKLRKHFYGKEERVMMNRGCGAATLVRTELVESIQIPNWLNYGEDEYIRKYILQQNYNYLELPINVGKHLKDYRRENWNKNIRIDGATDRLLDRRPVKNLLVLLLKQPLKSFLVVFASRNPKTFLFGMRWCFSIVYGWLNWKEILGR